MYQVLPESKDNVLGIKVLGDFDAVDYKAVFELSDKLIAKYGKIRILADLRDYKSLYIWDTLMAFPKRLQYVSSVEKKAVITDENWMYILTKFTAPFVSTQIRLFHSEEEDKAWEWVRE